MAKFKNLLGMQFGELKVIQRLDNDANGSARWLCECSCGKWKAVYGYSLLKGQAKSCGCMKSKLAIETRNKGKEKEIPLEERIMNKIHEIRERMSKLKLQNDSERLQFEILCSQICVLESLDDKFVEGE